MSWLQPSGVAGTGRDERLRPAGPKNGHRAACAVCHGVNGVSGGGGLGEGLSDMRLCFGSLDLPCHPSLK